MLCTIYKITNIKTNQHYIGQTIREPNIRWKEHQFNKPTTKIDFALQQDINNFTFSIVEQGEWTREELDLREKYWISYYDSYNNGYNQTIGGKGNGRIYDDEQIIDCFLYFESMRMTAKYLHSSPQTIASVLKKYNIDYKRSNGKTVYVTTEEGILIKKFKSISDAGRWLYLLNPMRLNSTYENWIREAIKTNKTIFGYNFSVDKPIESLQPYHIICRKIEPQYGGVISYIEKSLLTKNVLAVLNKNQLYGGFIWEECYPQEQPHISRYSKVAKQKYKEFLQERRQFVDQYRDKARFNILSCEYEPDKYEFFSTIDDAINYCMKITQWSRKQCAEKIYNDYMLPASNHDRYRFRITNKTDEVLAQLKEIKNS